MPYIFSAFAKIDIPAYTTITLYSGYKLSRNETEQFNYEAFKLLDVKNETDVKDPQRWIATKYHGGVQECGFTITIPHWLGATSHYRATLGHKLNHQFEPNCEYGGKLDSPRFGFIRAFHTNKDIKKGEELFISYGYPVESGPPWYTELYNKTVEEHKMKGINSDRLMKAIAKSVRVKEGDAEDNKEEKS